MLFSSAYLNFPSWTCTKSSLQSFPWLVTRNLSLNTSSIFPLGTEIIQTHLFGPLGVDIRDPTKVWFLFVWGKISPQGAERKSKRGSQVKSLKNVMYSLEKLIKKKKEGKAWGLLVYSVVLFLSILLLPHVPYFLHQAFFLKETLHERLSMTLQWDHCHILQKLWN